MGVLLTILVPLAVMGLIAWFFFALASEVVSGPDPRSIQEIIFDQTMAHRETDAGIIVLATKGDQPHD